MRKLLMRIGRHWMPLVVFAGCLSYFLSFGPACWLGAGNHRFATVVRYIYGPVIYAGSYGPDSVRHVITRYANMRAGTTLVIIRENRLWYLGLFT